MKAIDIPVKIETPFGENADPAFIAAIPQTTAEPGRASFTAGFPPENMRQVAAGGIPPWGQDMNGILNQISAWTRWQGAGAAIAYDAAFSTEIGGYPAGAALFAASSLGWWISQIDDNPSDPDTGGSNWLFVPIEQTWAGDPNTHVAGRAASGTSAPNAVWDTSNRVYWICVTTGNAAGTVWRALPVLNPVTMQTGTNRTYIADDIGKVYVRSNAGAAMADTLPDGTVGNGWEVSIINQDDFGTLTISAPAGRRLNGTLAGFVSLTDNQNVTITANATGDFWMTAVPVPRVFSAQAVYVNSNQVIVPGVYDLDSRPGPFTLTLESGGTLGDNYHFRDVGGALARNNVGINPNGSTINGVAANFPLDVNWSEIVINYNTGDWETT